MNSKVLLFRINELKRRIEGSAIQTFTDFQTIQLLHDVAAYIAEHPDSEEYEPVTQNEYKIKG